MSTPRAQAQEDDMKTRVYYKPIDMAWLYEVNKKLIVKYPREEKIISVKPAKNGENVRIVTECDR
jgi:hypothetical protein